MDFTLITGASSGIGEEFARQYAKKGHPLILVARSQDKLNQLAQELHRVHQIPIHVISQDLAQLNSAEELFQKCHDLGLKIDLLINDAGIGLIGKFDTHPLNEIEHMILLNVLTLTKLCYLFLPQLKERQGKLLNVASQVSFEPAPYMAAYAATKAYVLSLTEALYVEAEKEGVQVIALCPGATYTNFFKRAHSSPDQMNLRFSTPSEVVQEAIKGIENNKSSVIVGWDNRLMTFLTRFLPRSMLAKIAQFNVKK